MSVRWWQRSRRLVLLLMLVLALGAPARALGAEARDSVSTTAAPGWVDPPPPDAAGPDVQPKEGAAVLLFEAQTRHVNGQRWRFVRSVTRLENQIGVENAGQRTFAFVPPQQKLQIHQLEIRRDGQRLDRLKGAEIRVFQRETDAGANVYDGERTAMIVIPDLRVGDVVACEYSVIGQNPVLGGHVMESWPLGWPVGAGALRFRLVTDRAASLRVFGDGKEPEHRLVGALHEYRTEMKQPVPPVLEDKLPDDYPALPYVQLTDFTSWNEVARYGVTLFADTTPLSGDLSKLVEWVRSASSDPAAQVTSLLRRVQDDVRYLSLAFAESTHRPAPPSTVWQRRFGDCKDKSLLTARILRELGLDAKVALASSSGGEHLDQHLPMLNAFDHAIVRVTLKDHVYWLDPTRTYQRGNLQDVSVTGLGFALVLDPDTLGLAWTDDPSNHPPDVVVKTEFRIASIGGATTLDVKARYGGRLAEWVRAVRASSSAQDFGKKLGGVILDAYPHARMVGETTASDEPESNHFEVTQRFELDAEWKKDEQDRPFLSLFPAWMRGRFPTVPPDRKSPLAVQHPVHIVQNSTFEVTGGFSLKPESVAYESPVFRFRQARSGGPELVRVESEFETLGSRLDVAQFAAHRTAFESAAQALDLSLVRKAPPPEHGSWPPWWITAGAVAWSAALLGIARYVHVRQPYLKLKSVRWVPEAAGRKGWLALIGFGTTLAPIGAIFRTFPYVDLFSATKWAALTATDSPSYNPMLAPLVLVEAGAQLALVVGTTITAWSYWAGRRSFPLVFVVTNVFAFVYGAGDWMIASANHIGETSNFTGAGVGTYFGSLLWSVYMVQSERVKATFLPPPEENEF